MKKTHQPKKQNTKIYSRADLSVWMDEIHEKNMELITNDRFKNICFAFKRNQNEYKNHNSIGSIGSSNNNSINRKKGTRKNSIEKNEYAMLKFVANRITLTSFLLSYLSCKHTHAQHIFIHRARELDWFFCCFSFFLSIFLSFSCHDYRADRPPPTNV